MTLSNEVYWAAGILEGEGSFLLRRGGDLAVQVGSTDKDVVDGVESALGPGSRKERILPSGKKFYTWLVSNQDHARDIMVLVRPLMKSRRQARIDHCLAEFAKKPMRNSRKTLCKHGHELSGENLKVITEGKYTKRRCIECGRLRQQKYRATNASGILGL